LLGFFRECVVCYISLNEVDAICLETDVGWTLGLVSGEFGIQSCEFSLVNGGIQVLGYCQWSGRVSEVLEEFVA
jgi:hypothetical protein